MNDQDKHWLLRSANIRKLWLAFIAILLLSLVADLFVHQHQYFRIEDSFGFFAWYGFITCVAMVVLAKLLGVFLKRPENYYEASSNREAAHHD
jgi:hypothetical protein